MANANAEQSGKVSFADEVRPILNRNCTACHGGVKMAGDVSFIYRDLALGVGKSGKRIIVPGAPDKSEMMRRVVTQDADDIMPPAEHGKPLSKVEIDILRRWIKEGAEWQVHWAFEPPQETETPNELGDWATTSIDQFTLKEMREHGLEPSDEARPAVLLRRLKFDLLGFPPTIEELDTFEVAYAADSEKAWQRAIDRYLADPAYGERWTSVWMDLARYADSEGLGADRRRDVWPYRDWLIKAFNDDMPFDEFTIKQLAGDLLEERTYSDLIATVFHRLTQANAEGGTDDEEFRVAAVLDRVNTTWEVWQGQTFGCTQCHSHPYDTFEHKEYYEFAAFFNNSQDADLESHEPRIRVPSDSADYKGAYEAFRNVQSAELAFYGAGRKIATELDWSPLGCSGLKVNKGKAKVVELDDGAEVQTVGTVASNTRFDVDLKLNQKLSALRLEILPEDGAKAASLPNWGASLSYIELRVIDSKGKARVIPIQHGIPDSTELSDIPENSLIRKSSSGWGPFTKIFHPRWSVWVPAEPIELEANELLQIHLEFNRSYGSGTPLVAKRMRFQSSNDSKWTSWVKNSQTGLDKKHMAEMRKKYAAIRGPRIPVMFERNPALKRADHVFERGNWLEKGERLAQASTPKAFPALKSTSEAPNRLDMAKWLVSEDNPLTARVAVNRYWHQLFGRGIVETLEDFGSSGEKPSHPELLDYLAIQFQSEYAWSQKSLLREILLTKTYRQSAEASADNRTKDPRNVWQSYGSRRRIRAESVRDSGLAISGLLSPVLYGSPTFPPIPPGVWKPFVADKWTTPAIGEPQRYRRSLYTYWKRSIPYPALMSFDVPSREVCSKRRLVSNTPIAALTTLNDSAFSEFAQGLARRMKYKTKGSLEDKLSFGYRIVTSTRPSPEILKELTAAYHDIEMEYREQPQLMKGMAGTPDGAAFTVLASLLLNLDAALTK